MPYCRCVTPPGVSTQCSETQQKWKKKTVNKTEKWKDKEKKIQTKNSRWKKKIYTIYGGEKKKHIKNRRVLARGQMLNYRNLRMDPVSMPDATQE